MSNAFTMAFTMPLNVLTLTLALAMAGPAMAQSRPDPHAGHGAHGKAAPAAAASKMSEPTEGEVRRVDLDSARLTLKHGELKGLDMPPMTMVFGVRDKSLLDGLKAGDKVRFKVASEGGKLTVTEIARVK